MQLNQPRTLLISGKKGVRFSPQINYQLDSLSIWRQSLPDYKNKKQLFCSAFSINSEGPKLKVPNPTSIVKNSHIFLNGDGSSGKAGLALKIARAPYFDNFEVESHFKERILVVSFLYPYEFYSELLKELGGSPGNLEVIHLYPGFLKPNDLFNRILWRLKSGDLEGNSYTSIVIDGIHNLFVQFPEIEKYQIFWPQLYTMLKQREITVITTHTTLVVKTDLSSESFIRVDDERSEPLRHALIQKNDYQIEVSRVEPKRVIPENRQREMFSFTEHEYDRPLAYVKDPGFHVLSIRSAIGDSVHKTGADLYWHKKTMEIYQDMPK